jgi:hypothetical protein
LNSLHFSVLPSPFRIFLLNPANKLKSGKVFKAEKGLNNQQVNATSSRSNGREKRSIPVLFDMYKLLQAYSVLLLLLLNAILP